MATLSLTPRNMELLRAVLKHMSADVDFAAVAVDANMKTTKYARDEWKKLREKLTVASGGELSDVTPKSKTTPSRKRGVDKDDVEKSVSKKAKKNSKKEESTLENGDDEEETIIKDELDPDDEGLN